MDDSELAEIKKRCEKATPGPWFYSDNSPEYIHAPATVSDPYVLKARVESSGWERYDAYIDDGAEVYSGNLEFITHCRTDIPDLLAEIERLQELESKLLDINQGLVVENTALKVNRNCMEEHERIYETLGCKNEGEALEKIQKLQRFYETGEDFEQSKHPGTHFHDDCPNC